MSKYALFLFLTPSLSLAVDLARIDTGIVGIHKNVLNMHGTMMRDASDDQAGKLGIDINSVQIQCKFDIQSQSCTETHKDLSRASKMDFKVLSISLTGEGGDTGEKQALEDIQNKGSLVVAAAGNKYGSESLYPAAYGGDCLLAVGTSSNGSLASFSSIGEVFLEQVGTESGTSFSTARMAVIAVKYMKQGLSCKETKKRLIKEYGPTKDIQKTICLARRSRGVKDSAQCRFLLKKRPTVRPRGFISDPG